MKQGSNRRERAFERSVQSLEEIFSFIGEYLSESGISTERREAVNLIVEELFTNFVKYNSKGSNPIVISLALRDRELAVSLTDRDGDAFNLLDAPAVDVGQPLERRKPGGLGLHLVKSLADRIEQEQAAGMNRITFYKTLG